MLNMVVEQEVQPEAQQILPKKRLQTSRSDHLVVGDV